MFIRCRSASKKCHISIELLSTTATPAYTDVHRSNLVTEDLLDELAKRLVLRLELLRLLLLLEVYALGNYLSAIVLKFLSVPSRTSGSKSNAQDLLSVEVKALLRDGLELLAVVLLELLNLANYRLRPSSKRLLHSPGRLLSK